jgi:antitoxin (DNA-binding transcriptional repressor) of toxin-antitoxin stability system
MTIVTATDLARRTNQVLDALTQGESVTIKRNNTVLGTIVPPQRPMRLNEVLERMPQIPRDVGERFKADILNAGFDEEVRDPWEK